MSKSTKNNFTIVPCQISMALKSYEHLLKKNYSH
jgi:hypothetical protein